MSSAFKYEEESANIVIGVFNYVSDQLSRAREYFKTFADNVETYRKGTSCRDFAEVYEANRGLFRGGVMNINNIIIKGDELYDALYGSAFDSSVKRGQELAFLFRDCILSGAINRLYNMATYLQWVFDTTADCCLHRQQAPGKEKLFALEEEESKEEENTMETLIKTLERGVEYGWNDVIAVFPLEDIDKYRDFCEYLSKHATVENLAILFRGFSLYFSKVRSFVDLLLERAEQYKEGTIGRSGIMEPLRACTVKDITIQITKRRGERSGTA